MFLINPYIYIIGGDVVPDYVAMYKFADNGDDETGSHDATMSNVTYSSTGGLSGQGNYGIWNGTTSYGRVTDHANITDLKTISCWVYLDTIAGGHITNKDGKSFWGAISGHASYNDNSIILGVEFTTSFGRWHTDENSLSTSNWTHIAYTYAQDNNVATDPIVYIDGQSVNVNEFQTPIGTLVSDTGADLYIGNRIENNLATDGRLENLRFYDRVLTPTEILAIYNAEKP